MIELYAEEADIETSISLAEYFVDKASKYTSSKGLSGMRNFTLN
jgi:hypothetical protein